VPRRVNLTQYADSARGRMDAPKVDIYAFMQAMGLVNDRVEDCVIRAKVERAKKDFKRSKSS